MIYCSQKLLNDQHKNFLSMLLLGLRPNAEFSGGRVFRAVPQPVPLPVRCNAGLFFSQTVFFRPPFVPKRYFFRRKPYYSATRCPAKFLFRRKPYCLAVRCSAKFLFRRKPGRPAARMPYYVSFRASALSQKK